MEYICIPLNIFLEKTKTSDRITPTVQV